MPSVVITGPAVAFVDAATVPMGSCPPLTMLDAATDVRLAPLPLNRVAVIVPAVKFPEASRFTSVETVLALVPAFAVTAPAATTAAVCPFTSETAVADCVPVTSPAREPEKLVAVLPFKEFVASVALPAKFAVTIPAAKFPAASRVTMELAVFALAAVVAEFATFPLVEIVPSFVSEIAAAAAT